MCYNIWKINFDYVLYVTKIMKKKIVIYTIYPYISNHNYLNPKNAITCTCLFFLSSVHVYLVLIFDIFNIKILLIIFFLGLFFYIKKTHELLKAEHLRFKVYNF